MQLSKRLRTIIDMTGTADTAADIGTDHGFVPVALLSEGKARRFIAADINEGPLERARAHIATAGLSHACDLRCGTGLSVLRPEEADAIIIAGMGGQLIASILLEGREKLSATRQLVLSPHTESRAVREAVEAIGFHIEDETMVYDEGKFYPVILACPGEGAPMNETQLTYGPVLLEKRPADFEAYLSFRIRKEEEILRKIQDAEKKGNEAVLRTHEASLAELHRLAGR